MKQQKKSLSLKNLTKSTVWNIQENDVFRLWSQAERDADLKDNENHYLDIIKSAFTIEEIKVDKIEVIDKYEERGYKVGQVRLDDGVVVKWAIKKKTINRISDLTKDNIHHISARKLIEVLERNFGGGWDSLPKNVQDIILSAFEVTTTTLPTTRLRQKGGLYEKKVSAGYEVLEINKGGWTEAIFVKEIAETPDAGDIEPDNTNERIPEGKEDDFDDVEDDEFPKDDDGDNDDEDFDDDNFIEESYRTTFETSPEDLDIHAEDITDDGF